MRDQLQQYKKELQQELENILKYWMKYAPDNDNGGFYGKVDDNNRADPEAEKGVVLNARILWAFAAAYNHSKKDEYFIMARRAYHYILDHFIDKKHGGVYWSVITKAMFQIAKNKFMELHFAYMHSANITKQHAKMMLPVMQLHYLK